MSASLLAQKTELPVRERWMLDRKEAQREKLLQAAGPGPGSSAAAAGSGPNAVAALAASSNAVVVVSPHRSGGARRVEYDSGNVAPLDADLYGTREGELLAAIDLANAQARKQDKALQATTKIQSVARMFLDRRRFVLHRTRVKTEIAAIVAQRNMRCAITVQRCARGLVARLRYRRQREEEALAALEASKSKAGKGGKKAAAGASKGGAAGLNNLLSPQELALQQNANFIRGTRAYLVNNLDEAITALEQQQRGKPEPVTAAFLELVRRKRNGTPANAGSANNVTQSTASPGGKDAKGAKGKKKK